MNAIAALLSAVCVSVLAGVALAFPCGGLNPLIAALSLGAGAGAGILQYGAYLRGRQPGTPACKAGAWDRVMIVIYTLFSLRVFCWLVYWGGGQIKFLSINNFGDLALHLTYINNLASGVPFWPENPIFEGMKLHYPLGVDILNSLLKLAGMDVYRGLVWVGLAGALVTGVALYKWGRGFALAGFLFNGGLAGFQFFAHWHLADYQAELGWKSIPLAMFVTQRGLLYAIPAGLALLWSWRERFFPDKKGGEKPLPFYVEVLLYSTMPLFHLHTFIFLSLLLGCWIVKAALWAEFKQPSKLIPPAVVFGLLLLLKLVNLVAPTAALLLATGISVPLIALMVWKAWNVMSRAIMLVAWSFIPATLLTGVITGFFKSGSVVHFVWGTPADPKSWDWMYNEQPQFSTWSHSLHLPEFLAGPLGHAASWIVNFGSLPLFVALLVYVLARDRREPSAPRASAFVFPSVGIFIFSCFVMLAPWDWDNTKIMIWPYLTVLPFLWNQFLEKENFAVRGAFCFMLFFSGFVSLLGGIDNSYTGYDLAARSEVDGVASATRSLPVTAVFAAYPIHNHPLLLNGRNLVEGYDGHLLSHGIDYGAKLTKLNSLLNGEEGWLQTAKELHVRYIFWGKFEEENFPDSKQPWKDGYMKVAEGPWGAIYDLTIPVPPVIEMMPHPAK